jgi:c-di-GMP-binding flagellar brake protein YcgR
MSSIQELSNQQMDEAVAEAVDRRVPVVVTVQKGRTWQIIPARALALRDLHLLLELSSAGGAAPWEFAPAEKVGVSFKLKHHKHIFTATVVGLEEGKAGGVLAVCRPSRMQRLQRRAYIRAEVPANRIVRASFWLGGQTAEPTGASPTTPVWSGRVVNISAGGFQLHVDTAAAGDVEIGDMVGVRIVFGMGEQAVYADAEVRHIEPLGPKAMVGFRFLGLDQTHDGRGGLQIIATKVAEYERLAEGTRKAPPSGSFRAPSTASKFAADED